MSEGTLAFEEDAGGTTVGEKELVFYARLENLDALKTATGSEEQEQWQVKIYKNGHASSPGAQPDGRIRVRRTRYRDGQCNYVQTIKIPQKGSVMGHTKMDETSFEVTEDVFNQFRRLATDGMRKTRYFFTVTDERGQPTSLEVDVFPLTNGKTANWCKIDYEYSGGAAGTPTFPPGFVDIIRGDTKDPHDRDFIMKLYSEIFHAR
jgi:hypothetical protein